MSDTRYFRVSGRVQGVGFRVAACEQARALGLAGWVRNRAAGDVELVARGEPAALEQLATWLRHGPSAARVKSVETETVEADHALPEPFAVNG